MTVTFDTLTYSKRLREAGVPEKQADAHAEAALYLFRAIGPSGPVAGSPAANSDSPATRVDFAATVERATRPMTIGLGGMIIGAFAVYGLLIFGVFGK